MLQVITGKVCPGVKLAESYPLRLEDTPAYHYFPGKEYHAQYREGLYVGYRYYDTAKVPVQFPFGFGLSYICFSYSDLSVDEKKAHFTLTNTGSREGAESCPAITTAGYILTGTRKRSEAKGSPT